MTEVEGKDRPAKIGEYSVLLTQVVNERRNAYSSSVAAFGASIALLVSTVTLILAQDVSPVLVLGIAALPVVILWFARGLVRRVETVSTLRLARAVQIEKELGLYNIRLLPPWNDAPPEDFLLTLGELVSVRRWDGDEASRKGLESSGSLFLQRVASVGRQSKNLELLFLGTLVVSVIAVVVALFNLIMNGLS